MHVRTNINAYILAQLTQTYDLTGSKPSHQFGESWEGNKTPSGRKRGEYMMWCRHQPWFECSNQNDFVIILISQALKVQLRGEVTQVSIISHNCTNTNTDSIIIIIYFLWVSFEWAFNEKKHFFAIFTLFQFLVICRRRRKLHFSLVTPWRSLSVWERSKKRHRWPWSQRAPTAQFLNGMGQNFRRAAMRKTCPRSWVR